MSANHAAKEQIPDHPRRLRRLRRQGPQVFEALLADDFTFTSPYDDAIGKAVYFERCWPNNERFASFDIERIFEKGPRRIRIGRASPRCIRRSR